MNLPPLRFALVVSLLPLSLLRADPPEAVAKVSVFTSLKAGDIAADTVLGKAGPELGFAKGVGVQTCYWLPLPPEAAAKFVQTWNPTPHAELGVFASRLSSEEGGGVSTLSLDSGNGAQKWLLDKSRNAVASAEAGDLNLSRKEAAALAQGDPVAGWRAILAAREAALFATPPYEAGGKAVNPSEELRALLTDDPKLRQQMAPVIRALGVMGNEGGGGAAVVRHWELLTAERHGVVTLGASAACPAGAGDDGRWQLLDVDYYASGEYDVSATFYEFRPWTVGGKAGSLVWENDLIASPAAAESGGGMEGMAVSSLFLRDVKQAVHLMKVDAAK